MGTLLENLLSEARRDPGADSSGPFKPIARFYPSLDFVLYLNEDCSYRADRIDPFLTVLWHPNENRLVGIKLKGFRFLFDRVKSILNLKDEHFFPVVKALEVAFAGGVAEAIMAQQGNRAEKHERVMKAYAQAREIAENVTVDARAVYKEAA